MPTSASIHLRRSKLATVAAALLGAGQLLGPGSASGLEPYRVADIDPVPAPDSSDPELRAAHRGLAYFVADDGESGRELWRSNGAAAGTVQVLDACPGPCSGNPVVRGATPRGLFFSAVDGSVELGLWVHDRGAPVRLAQHLPFTSFRQGIWVEALQRLFFVANDGTLGAELWSSDGTPAGTRLVRDLVPGPGGPAMSWPVVIGGRVYFTATTPGLGAALWTSDGTAAGTRVVWDPAPKPGDHAEVGVLASLGSRLILLASTPGRGYELWSSDGTPKGTTPLPELVRGNGSPGILRSQTLGGRFWFQAETPQFGEELWVTDGTPKGTRRATSFANPRALSGALLPVTSLGGLVVFPADDGVHGLEPWVTDGTIQGSRLLHDVCPGPCPGDGWAVGIVASRLVLRGTNPRRGGEPWVTDGTPAGTRLLGDLCPGRCSSQFTLMEGTRAGQGRTALVTRSYDDQGESRALWVTDATPAGTKRITDYGTVGAPGGIALGIRVRETLFFPGHDEAHGVELWRSDLTSSGTRLVTDLARSDLGGSNPGELFGAGSRLYFLADDGIHGAELWSSDGTDGGTSLVADLEPGPQPGGSIGFARSAVALGSEVVFVRHRLEGRELWRSDGTAAGTFRLTPDGLDASGLVTAGGRVFFAGGFQFTDQELWVTDGAVEGTRQVADLAAGESSSRPSGLVAFGNRVAFWADGDEGRGLWVSDGTEAGTMLVPGLDGADLSHIAEQLAAAGDMLFFLGRSPTTGRLTLWKADGSAEGSALLADLGWFAGSGPSLHPLGSGVLVLGPQGAWRSDGTAGGTSAISDLPLGQGGFSPPVAFAGSLYFQIHHEGQRLLWRSDGTAAGTGPVLDHLARPIRDPQAPSVLGGSLVFAALEGGDIWLWTSLGTSETTRPLHRLRIGSGWGIELAVASSRLFFAGHDEAGWELWALRP